MHVEGDVIHYLLAREFSDVTCDKQARRVEVDYPILYDETGDMRGHAALVPAHERPGTGIKLEGALCICMGESSAASARAAGLAVIEVHDRTTFQRLYNYIQAMFVRFERLDVRLRAYIDARSGAQPLLDACARATGCPLALVDDEYRIVCQSSPESAPDPDAHADASEFDMLESDVVDLFMGSRSYRPMRTNRSVFAIPGSPDLLMKNLFVEGNLAGALVGGHDGTPLGARYARFVLRYLGSYVEKMRGQLGSFGIGPTEADRIRAALAELLAKGTEGHAAIQALIAGDGRISSDKLAVLRIERTFTYEGHEELEYLARRFELAWPHAYCFIADGTLFMLAGVGHPESEEAQDFMQDILVAARDNLAKVGMSRQFSSLDHIDAARFQATAALEQGSATDPTYWFYRFDDYALEWILTHGVHGTPVEYVTHPAMVILSRHDNEHDTELVRTLSMFMSCKFNATHAANRLFVARSTLLNRIERISELTGVDFDDTDELTYLAISLKLFN